MVMLGLVMCSEYTNWKQCEYKDGQSNLWWGDVGALPSVHVSWCDIGDSLETETVMQ